MSVTTAPPPIPDRFAVPPEPVLQLTVGQYHEMARAGVLQDGEPIELLEGWLVNKMIKVPTAFRQSHVRKCRLARWRAGCWGSWFDRHPGADHHATTANRNRTSP